MIIGFCMCNYQSFFLYTIIFFSLPAMSCSKIFWQQKSDIPQLSWVKDQTFIQIDTNYQERQGWLLLTGSTDKKSYKTTFTAIELKDTQKSLQNILPNSSIPYLFNGWVFAHSVFQIDENLIFLGSTQQKYHSPQCDLYLIKSLYGSNDGKYRNEANKSQPKILLKNNPKYYIKYIYPSVDKKSVFIALQLINQTNEDPKWALGISLWSSFLSDPQQAISFLLNDKNNNRSIDHPAWSLDNRFVFFQQSGLYKKMDLDGNISSASQDNFSNICIDRNCDQQGRRYFYDDQRKVFFRNEN